jgi:ferredoxin
VSGRRDFFRRLVDRVMSDTEPRTDAAEPSYQPRPTSVPRASAPTTPSPASPSAKRAIRPPGALPPPAFQALCVGCDSCDACLRACPEDAITRGADGLPTLQPARVPCVLCTTVPCAAACPTGALVPLAPAAIRIARVEVAANLCLNQHSGEACTGCHGRCPIPSALTLDTRGIPTIDAALCTGCGVCAANCRAYPPAIFVTAP